MARHERSGERRAVPERSYRTVERDGWEILVGKGARDNDTLTFQVARQGDLWLHVSGWSGSHVVIRVPEEGEPPRDVVQFAARLAAWHSKARGAKGKVEVHVCRAGDVKKRAPGAPAGQVQLARWSAVKVYAREEP